MTQQGQAERHNMVRTIESIIIPNQKRGSNKDYEKCSMTLGVIVTEVSSVFHASTHGTYCCKGHPAANMHLVYEGYCCEEARYTGLE